jgi:flagellar biogenesis protein FliO
MPFGRDAVDTEHAMEMFGGMPDAARFVVAFLLVLGLIGAGAFLWRRFGGGPLSTTGPRGRQPRLAVIDAANVDGRRRLVLIRRDNTEHLLMIGGPSDIVIEPNISRATPNTGPRDQRPVPDLPGRQPVDPQSWSQPVEPLPRVARPLDELEPVRPEPARTEPARPDLAARSAPVARLTPFAQGERYRSDRAEDEIPAPDRTPMPPEPDFQVTVASEPRRPSVQPPPPNYEPVFQTAPEPRRGSAAPAREPIFQTEGTASAWSSLAPTSAAHEPVFQSPVTAEPKRAQPAAVRPSQNDENNLAEMAQRLEAALRRPTKPVESAPPPAPPAPPRPAPRAEPTATSRVAAYFGSPAPAVSAPTRSQDRVPERGQERGQTDAPESISSAIGSVMASAGMSGGTQQAPEVKIVPAQDRVEPPSAFGSLEEEMASLLGRTPGKT